jgi:hypothetical protein
VRDISGSEPRHLGHIISACGVATNPKKTHAMLQWPTPSNATELKGFLEFTGYYKKFVKHYDILTKPLTNLLPKKLFHCDSDARNAFDRLKVAMSSTPLLALPGFSK